MNHINIFLEAIVAERGRSKRTVASYKSDLELASAQLGDLTHLSSEDIADYLASLSHKGIGASTIARKTSAFRSFYRFLALEKIITKNPTLSLELPRVAKPLPKYLTADEIEDLINAAG
ncbi:MAG: site-specific integrase, partial [Alphaproteobacteria bacterium]|nr:site-specific integrase [Alphaproteobacteria bacterium]